MCTPFHVPNFKIREKERGFSNVKFWCMDYREGTGVLKVSDTTVTYAGKQGILNV